MMAEMSLQDRKVLITGAGRGIGAALARGFARAGAHVACAARTEAQVSAVAAEIAAEGGQALGLVCDVSHLAQVEAMCCTAARTLGGLDILICNAGMEMAKATVADSDPDMWGQVLATNLTGAYYCARTAVPYLRRQGGGKIIMVGSGMGHKGAARSSAYCCSKAGLWMLTRVLAQEVWADGISVNELIPGPVDTAMTGWTRTQGQPAAWESEWFKQPEAVVPLALFLARQPAMGPTAQSFSLMRRDN